MHNGQLFMYAYGVFKTCFGRLYSFILIFNKITNLFHEVVDIALGISEVDEGALDPFASNHHVPQIHSSAFGSETVALLHPDTSNSNSCHGP